MITMKWHLRYVYKELEILVIIVAIAPWLNCLGTKSNTQLPKLTINLIAYTSIKYISLFIILSQGHTFSSTII